ncbi:MAG TPA: DUF72 domain-containing protein [Gemmatimonadales bacterium]|nr:DUF72 domain-containing protein [Gemmatimonadales bacterium]
MALLAGTSGWSFKEWKGSFYPKGLPDDGMLGYYAGKFSTVEINNTFYRMPKESVLLDWASKVPDAFRFAIKASQRITHFGRLKDVESEVEYFTRITSVLGDRRGPTLFQLPPNLKKDLPRLAAFLEVLPRGWKSAFEFRHSSWFEDDVYEALRSKDAAMCIADHDDFETPAVRTASWGYARLHRLTYDDSTLGAWRERLNGLGVAEMYVFFKHDETAGSGPAAAEAFVRS